MLVVETEGALQSSLHHATPLHSNMKETTRLTLPKLKFA
jgi:hypothetical protein